MKEYIPFLVYAFMSGLLAVTIAAAVTEHTAITIGTAVFVFTNWLWFAVAIFSGASARE